MTEDYDCERRISTQELANQIQDLQRRIEVLESALGALESTLQPIAKFFSDMESDFVTLGRFGRVVRSTAAWAAAIIIAIGVVVAWVKNDFKFPGT